MKRAKSLQEKNNAQLENCQQYGTGGLLTMAFADVIKSLWSNDINERIAREFYEVVRQFNNEYGTFRQQVSFIAFTAYQFFLFLPTSQK